MKKLYFLLFALSFFTTTNAQIVNIPDANFKAKLLAASSNNTIASINFWPPINNQTSAYVKIDTRN
jgi:hypothetical protein